MISGDAITESNNLNLSNSDDPDIDRKIDELKSEPDVHKVTDEWAELDKELVKKAYVAPYGNEEASSFFSERMDFENCAGVHPVYGNNWAQFCLK